MLLNFRKKVTNKIKDHYPLFIAVVAFLAVIFLINPIGEFPINDDWNKQLQIGAFHRGLYRLYPAIDAAFILQAIIGYFWSFIFGYSFISLRILTILFTVATLTGLYLILKLQKVSQKPLLLLLLIVVANPLIIASSITFMTEMYFLAFMVFSVYFYLLWFKNPQKLLWLFLGSLLCGLSIMVRQIGLVVFIALLCTVFYLILTNKKEFSNIFRISLFKKLLLTVVPIIGCFILWRIWPKYNYSDQVSIFSNLIESKFLLQRLPKILQSIPFFGFCFMPLFYLHFQNFKKSKWLWFGITVLTGVGTFYIFKYDVFPLGNVFYLENLYGRTKSIPDFSFFDSIAFKLFLSGLISFGLSSFILGVALQIAKLKKITSISASTAFLLFSSIGMFLILFLSGDIYDRYTLPFFIFCVILYVTSGFLENKKLNFFPTYPLLFLMIFISVVLNNDYFAVTRLKWDHAQKLQELQTVKYTLMMDDIYTRYMFAKNSKNFDGYSIPLPKDRDYFCYVYNYTLDTDWAIFKWSDSLETLLSKKLDNPQIYGRKKVSEAGKIKKHFNQMFLNEEYFSPLHNLIGKRAFVGSWCDTE